MRFAVPYRRRSWICPTPFTQRPLRKRRAQTVLAVLPFGAAQRPLNGQRLF
jgi:hypothetical protein